MRFVCSLVVLVSAAFAQSKNPVPEVGANLPAQAVGPNDLIAVLVYDSPELSRTIRVGACCRRSYSGGAPSEGDQTTLRTARDPSVCPSRAGGFFRPFERNKVRS